MKNLTTFNDTAIDNIHVDPVPILKLEFLGLTLFLCDKVWGATGSENVFDDDLYEPLIISWGTSQQGEISPITYETETGTMDVIIDNNTPVGGVDRFTKLFTIYDPHFVDVTYSLIFAGASVFNDKIDRFKGRIEDTINMLSDQITLIFAGFEIDIGNRFLHDIVNTTDYASADPDDIGKMLPQVYGSAKKVPFMGVDLGAVSTLLSDVSHTVVTLDLTDSTPFPGNGAVRIDSEIITYTGNVANQLTGCTRATSGTTATAHKVGAGVAEVQTSYFYAIGHPIKAFDDVYVDDVRQTGNYNDFTGQIGDQHGSYGALAIIEFTADMEGKKLIDTVGDNAFESVTFISLDADIPSTVQKTGGGASTTTWTISALHIAGQWTPTYGNYALTYDSWTEIWEFIVTVNDYGTAGTYTISINGIHSVSSAYVVVFQIDKGVVSVPLNTPYVFPHNTGNPTENGQFKVEEDGAWDGDATVTITNVSAIVNDALKIDDRGITQSSMKTKAATRIGGRVSADIQGWQDEDDGRYTGTANALIEQPDHIAKHLLSNRCVLADNGEFEDTEDSLWADTIDSTWNKDNGTIHNLSYALAGAYYNAQSYTLAVVLLQKPNVRALISRIAYQSKSLEFWEAGEHHLIPMTGTETLDKTFEGNRIDLNQIWIKYTDRVNIENSLSARYARDWSGFEDNVESDRSVVVSTDATSIVKYGTLEGEQYAFNYITGSTMAQAILDWIKGDLANPRLIIEFVTGFYGEDVERGDVFNFLVEPEDIFEDTTESSWEDSEQDSWHKESGTQELSNAMIDLIISTNKFRVLDKTYRPDASQQIQAVAI